METTDDLFCRRLAPAADRDRYDAWIDAIVDGDDVLDLVTRLSALTVNTAGQADVISLTIKF